MNSVLELANAPTATSAMEQVTTFIPVLALRDVPDRLARGMAHP